MTEQTVKISLIGAGGKMGGRVVDHLKDNPSYHLQCVETSKVGQQRLRDLGLEPIERGDAVADADVVILALPDVVIGQVARAVLPRMKTGAMLFTLDPAASHAGEIPEHPDRACFVSHPCHPSVFDHFHTQAELDDFFGGVHARQAVVCALFYGPESSYALGEQVARDIYAPVTRAHRITVEQMAILEPTMAEVSAIALIKTIREILEEAIERGVPRAAAEDFMYGHLKVALGIAFDRAPFPFSDGANLIASYGQRHIVNQEWREVFEPENVRKQVRAIVQGVPPEEL